MPEVWGTLRMVPDVGTRVRVSYEGVVKKVAREPGGASHCLTIEREDGSTGIVRIGPGTHDKVEAIEPEYVDGGVYRDADGDIFKYSKEEHGWLDFGEVGPHSYGYPARPLVRIDK